MAGTEPNFLTFRDIMAKVGEFLFYWSCLEQQLTDSIRRASSSLNHDPPALRGGLKERLDLWLELLPHIPDGQGNLHLASEVRDQALALRDVRNLIVHGVHAGHAAPSEGTAHIRCAIGGYEDPDSETVCYTLDQLEHFTQGVDACRRAFGNLNHFNYRVHVPVSSTSRAKFACDSAVNAS